MNDKQDNNSDSFTGNTEIEENEFNSFVKKISDDLKSHKQAN